MNMGKITAEPRSDQWNAEDFIGGPRVFTIADIKPGKAEGKYDIELVEGEGRVWRPPLTVLRQLLGAWKTDERAEWVGRLVKLYRDPTVTNPAGGTGGIRVSHVSHIDAPWTDYLSVKRGKRGKFTIEPMDRRDILRAEYVTANEGRRKEILAEVDALS